MKQEFIDLAQVIHNSIDHNRECGKEDKFSIEQIADFLQRRFEQMNGIEHISQPDKSFTIAVVENNVDGCVSVSTNNISRVELIGALTIVLQNYTNVRKTNP
jgi:hypothetical protein